MGTKNGSKESCGMVNIMQHSVQQSLCVSKKRRFFFNCRAELATQQSGGPIDQVACDQAEYALAIFFLAACDLNYR